MRGRRRARPQRSGRRGLGLDEDAGEALHADVLDQHVDLRLGATQAQRTVLVAQSPREYRQVEHQGRVGEDQLGEVDDDVRARLDRLGQGPTAQRRGRTVLVPRAAQQWWICVKRDDGPKLADVIKLA